MKSLSVEIMSIYLLFLAQSDIIIDCVVNKYHLDIQSFWGQCDNKTGNMAGKVLLCFTSNFSNKFHCCLYLFDNLVQNILHFLMEAKENANSCL